MFARPCTCRVPPEIIARLGRWAMDVMHTNYVTGLTVIGKLACNSAHVRPCAPVGMCKALTLGVVMSTTACCAQCLTLCVSLPVLVSLPMQGMLAAAGWAWRKETQSMDENFPFHERFFVELFHVAPDATDLLHQVYPFLSELEVSVPKVRHTCTCIAHVHVTTICHSYI